MGPDPRGLSDGALRCSGGEALGKTRASFSSDLRACRAWRASSNSPVPGRPREEQRGWQRGGELCSAPSVGPLPRPLTHFFWGLTGSTSHLSAALPENVRLEGPFAPALLGCLLKPEAPPIRAPLAS